MTVTDAVEVFVKAFCIGKSATYPYVAENWLEGEPRSSKRALWHMRDYPPRKNHRKAEVVAFGLPPDEVIRRIAEKEIGWHFLCALQTPEDELSATNAAYKELGYRKLATEWVFYHDLSKVPKFDCDPPVARIVTKEDAEAINRIAGQKEFRTEKFSKEQSDFRQYGVWDETLFIGKVRSVALGKDAWVSDLIVRKECRSLGFGKALMSKLLQDDKRLGVRNSVLVASADGARIYPTLGYELMAVMPVYCPRER